MSSKKLKVAVVGATGAVGEAMLSILAERKFPASEVIALASERSAGTEVKYGIDDIDVLDLATFDLTGVDIALFSAGSDISREYAPKFAAAGAVVIDNSSAFRYDDDVPLVVSEVNPEAAKNRPRGIIANPNCSTMQMVVALKPIYDAAGISRINVATYQSTSGAGRSGMEELGRQTAELLNFQSPEPKKFQVQIAFNLIPQIDDFLNNGYTKEEMKLVWETRKKISADEVRALLEQAPGVEVVDEHKPGGYPTPVTHASGNDPVYVGRIRDDASHPSASNMWIVSDNIRKGAALNAVQIAELVASGG